MHIACVSSYGQYGCYELAFYVPTDPGSTSLDCRGHGCYLLELYALNGFADITNLTVSGCNECGDVADCVDQWQMHCGPAFERYAAFDGHIDSASSSSSSSTNECGLSDDHFVSELAASWTDGSGGGGDGD